MTDSLTTKEVASLLRVSEATVKRWADNGLLRPDRTAGGHRRFSLQAVARLRRKQGMEPRKELAPQNARKKSNAGSRASSANLTESLLRGDEKEAMAVLLNAYLQGQTLVSLFDTTITESMHRIGELWFQGRITIADEHLATRVLLGALHELRDIVVPAESTGLRAVSCGIEGDLHEVPIHLAGIILETEGWEIKNLGPNTPLFALREMVTQQRPQLVSISARSIADLDRATNEYAQLRAVTAKLAASVVIGGEGFRDKTIRERFPSDFYAKDFAGFSKFVRTMTRKK